MTALKQALGLVGILVALAGIATRNRMVVWVAIGLLAASILVRMVLAARARRAGQEDASEVEPPAA